MLRHAIVAGLLSWIASEAAEAQIIVLVDRGASMYQVAAKAFQQQIPESQQIQLDVKSRSVDSTAIALRGNPPQLVVAIGTHAAQFAKEQFRRVPIIYCLVLNPIQNDLFGPNIGGVSLNVEPSQQLASLQKVVPKVKRIGVIYDEPISGWLVREAQKQHKPGIQIRARDARTPREAAGLIEEMLAQVDAFWMLWDPVIANPANFKLLVEFSLKNKVALLTPASPFVEAGALMSVEPDYIKAGRRAAEMAQQVLDGKHKPGDFGAEPPAEVVLTINQAVARRVGIAIPRNLPAVILSPASEQ